MIKKCQLLNNLTLAGQRLFPNDKVKRTFVQSTHNDIFDVDQSGRVRLTVDLDREALCGKEDKCVFTSIVSDKKSVISSKEKPAASSGRSSSSNGPLRNCRIIVRPRCKQPLRVKWTNSKQMTSFLIMGVGKGPYITTSSFLVLVVGEDWGGRARCGFVIRNKVIHLIKKIEAENCRALIAAEITSRWRVNHKKCPFLAICLLSPPRFPV